MNQDKKLRLLMAPLFFMVLLFVPGMIFDIVPSAYIEEMPEVIWVTFWLILWMQVLIWAFTFYHIPIGVYIAVLTVYTVVSWTWILIRKKGTVMYFIVWLVLCALSILMYWKCGELYHFMLNA